MGWSAGAKACDVLDQWSKLCIDNTGSQNVWHDGKNKYFWEASRTEHSDGAITGAIWKYCEPNNPDSLVRRSGTFRIEGDGTITRAPAFLKQQLV